jgi:hypothetical protein
MAYHDDKVPHRVAAFSHELPQSMEWMEANAGLFRYLSNTVRFINPHKYSMFKYVHHALPDHLQSSTAGVFAQAAIYQDMTKNGGAHIDCMDIPFGFNVVVSFGSYTTANLLLWEAQQAIECVPGDATFFLGRAFTHNAAGIVGGTRHIIDLSTHLNIMKWARKTVKGDKDTLAQNAKAWPDATGVTVNGARGSVSRRETASGGTEMMEWDEMASARRAAEELCNVLSSIEQARLEEQQRSIEPSGYEEGSEWESANEEGEGDEGLGAMEDDDGSEYVPDEVSDDEE